MVFKQLSSSAPYLSPARQRSRLMAPSSAPALSDSMVLTQWRRGGVARPARAAARLIGRANGKPSMRYVYVPAPHSRCASWPAAACAAGVAMRLSRANVGGMASPSAAGLSISARAHAHRHRPGASRRAGKQMALPRKRACAVKKVSEAWQRHGASREI